MHSDTGVAPRIAGIVLLKLWDAIPGVEFRILRLEFCSPRAATLSSEVISRAGAETLPILVGGVGNFSRFCLFFRSIILRVIFFTDSFLAARLSDRSSFFWIEVSDDLMDSLIS